MTPIFSEDEELSNELDLSDKSELEKVTTSKATAKKAQTL